MKRYLLFFGDFYYPVGGWGDFQESFDDLPGAIIYLVSNHKNPKYNNIYNFDWWHIFDFVTGKPLEIESVECPSEFSDMYWLP
jgi:hypothetical protein